MTWYRWAGEDLILALRVQPRAHRDAWVGAMQDHFKVSVCAPPVEGQANAHLIQFIAKSFGVAQSRVLLESGAGARIKRLRILAPRALPAALQSLGPLPCRAP